MKSIKLHQIGAAILVLALILNLQFSFSNYGITGATASTTSSISGDNGSIVQNQTVCPANYDYKAVTTETLSLSGSAAANLGSGWTFIGSANISGAAIYKYTKTESLNIQTIYRQCMYAAQKSSCTPKFCGQDPR